LFINYFFLFEMAEITVHIRCSNAQKFTVKVNTSKTVQEFKEQIAEEVSVPAPQQRLIYKGRVLKDEQTLESYSVEEDQTVHLVKGAAPAGSNPPQPTAASAPPTNPASVPTFPGLNFGAGTGAAADPLGVGGLDINSMMQMMNAAGPGGLGAPNMQQMQQQLMQNPELMRNIMSSPLMQNIMNDPEILRNIMLSNPQMRQVMDSNPQLTHLLNDPALMRQTMEMARNPEAMQQMMRNQDLAMANISNMPGGFNALASMYRDVQEPMMDALTGAGTPATRNTSQPPARPATGTSPAPNTSALPNPWASGGAAPPNPAAAGTAGAANPWASPGNAAGAANPWAALGGAGGLGGAGLGMPPVDPNFALQMMQNPLVQQQMQTMLENPALMQQMMSSNPMMQQMLQTHPEMRAVFENPDTMRQMFNPTTIAAMANLQQSMSQLQSAGILPGANPFGVESGGSPASNLDFSSLLTQMNQMSTGASPAVPVSTQPQQSPEIRYASQLSQLNDMGFVNAEDNIRALVATGGNINAAVERLLNGL